MHRNIQPVRAVRGIGPGPLSQAASLPWRTLLLSEEAKGPPPPQLINKDPAFSDGSCRVGLRMGGEAEA